MSASRRALLTFALTSDTLRSERDILNGLLPLFLPIALDLSGQIFNSSKLVDQLGERYGITISSDVAEFISLTLSRAGVLKRVETSQSDLLFRWVEPIAASVNAQNHDQQISSLADAAIEFSKKENSLLTWNLDQDSALDMLFDWIIDQDDVLRRAEDSLDSDTSAIGVSFTELSTRLKRSEKSYFCTKFVSWLDKAHPRLHQYVADLGNALLVSEVVLELRSPSVTAKVKGGLVIYLDAPLLMDLLGCNGLQRKADMSFLVDSLKGMGASVSVFSHSIDELKGNLRGVLNARSGERHGPTANAILRREVLVEYLQSILSDPERHIGQADVQIFDVIRTKLPVNTEELFPKDAKQNLLSKFLQSGHKLEAAERDVGSAEIVLRRRGFLQASDLFQSRHAMITRNPMVSTLANRLCFDEKLLRANNLGPFVMLRQAAALVWLAGAAKDKSEISRRQLVSSCSRALESAPQVAAAMRRKLQEVSSANAEQFDALISEPRNLQLLMDFSRGTVLGAMQVDPEELLRNMKSELVAEEAQKAAAVAKDFRSTVRKERNARAAVEQELEIATEILDRERAAQASAGLKILGRILAKSKCRAQFIESLTKLAAALALCAVGFLSSNAFLSWSLNWNLLISTTVGLLSGMVIFLDPRQLIERFAVGVAQRDFKRQVDGLGLAAVLERVRIDWSAFEVHSDD